VERLFSGNQHLGVSDDTVIRRIIDLALNGIWRKDNSGQSAPEKSGVTEKKPNRAATKSKPSKKKSRKPGNSTKEK
jgi:hypothetical protein